MATELKKLSKQERFCMDSLKNLERSIGRYNEETDKNMLETWKEYLEEINCEFRSVRLELELLDEFQEALEQSIKGEEGRSESIEDINQSTRAEFELLYLKIKGFLGSKMQKPSTSTAIAVQPITHTVQSRVKLPEIKLLHFDGSIREWPTFRDTFQSLIGSTPQLSNVDKFSYLVSSLSKDAKRVIEVIEVTAANYSVAWDLLEKRYENKYLLVKSYVEALFAVESMRKECHESLNKLIDEYERNLKMLEKVGEHPDDWSTILVFMLSSRLDSATMRNWETHRRSTNVPTYKELIEFLRSHSLILQSVAAAKPRPSDTPRTSLSSRSNTTKLTSAHSAMSTPQKTCPFCKQSSHSPFQCEIFRKMTATERFEATKKNALCINCLSPSHLVKNCASGACRVCNHKHHTMLHQRTNSSNSQTNQPQASKPSSSGSQSSSSSFTPANHSQSAQANKPSTSPENPAPTVTALSASHFSSAPNEQQHVVPTTVLLSTALVKVFNPTGQSLWARALLDSGSQLNFISEQLVQKLRLRRNKEFIPISGVGLSSTLSKYSTTVRIQSHRADFDTSWKFHVLSKITMELPNQVIDVSSLKIPSDILLADPSFSQPGPIDLIFGVENFYDLLKDGQLKNGPETPILQNTALGWVVSGKVRSGKIQSSVANFAFSTGTIEEQLARFWEIESCHTTSTLSLEEAACEEHFAKTTTRDPTGRFVVTLPKREAAFAKLGSSKEIATRRFLALERRLLANQTLKESYAAFIHEYAELGHMKLITNPDPALQTYYLPHHCVVRPDSITTKLRVVFDASCPTDTGVSLNDVLMVGPQVQDDLVVILLRFRFPQYAIISDIEKMYRQILMSPPDQQLLLILWRDSPSEPIRTYQLTTVTYGTSSAPYLATKCLQKLAEIGSKSHSVAAAVVGKDFYMDDLLTGNHTVEEGQELIQQLLQLMQSAGLPLRKWASNSPSILQVVPETLRDERTLLDIEPSSPVKTLGLQWDTRADEFRFEVPQHSKSLPITKRIVLSDIARLFDPLGLVGPVVVQAKLFMQELWREGKAWDEELSDSAQRQWIELRDNLEGLGQLSVPRWVIATPSAVSLQLHGFCDASTRAYGACIYVRAVLSNGDIFANLLTAKSKVAPLGNSKRNPTVCLPRLELSAALLLSHLFEKVESSVNLQAKGFFWTDSTIVYHWLSSSPSRWKTFVANRVSEIQQLTAKGIWGHVPGLENPADVISRGMSPNELKDFAAWWNGPDWLRQPPRFWPSLSAPVQPECPPDQLEEKSIALPVQVLPPNELFSLYSSFTRLLRITTLIRRFIHNSNPQNREVRRNGLVTTAELREATENLVRIAQVERFTQDFADIARDGQVKKNSRLKALSPLLSNGILRVGGRLRNAPVTYNQRHPMILPNRHPLTDLILKFYHLNNFHAGPQLMTAVVRERFWPLRVRDLARQVVHSCVKCFRCKPEVMEQLMGELPPERVTPAFPFLRTGVDYCGPFFYRALQRGPPVKCYIAIFVCLVTKAAHVECVADLSSQAFIAALKRFVARRGKPDLIECDNALNFRGAKRELDELVRLFGSQHHQHLIASSCADDGITFKFIPPRSPNFGGLWEAAVKSLKKHLRSTLGNVILYLDNFLTLITQIEACLNSRPLTQLTADPNDLEVLTPGHFLVHRALIAVPEPSLEGTPMNRLDRWQQTHEYVRRIWKQWQTDYLSGLQPRTRWTQQRDNVNLDTMVLLKDENLPPLKWRLGRVTQVFRGDDNNIRVVTVRTKEGEFRRAITKICVLPIQQPSGDPASSADEQEGI
ncbi:uncharacterized protein LOC128745608 [Sabethes cyaneus]|uniref:uncharacterized protein LOC128745608 n=1 Tax=Sabethes cyaneus TaxID=53552 RepID=UPI00237D4F47|nr:uncharacterized protein LOC128745608 [Sabethes cyaneus]